MTAANTENVDFDRIQEALAQFDDLGGPEFVAEIIGLLNQHTPEQLAAIETALMAGDLATAQRHAHSMKSTLGSFGATTCQECAVKMDRAGKDGDVNEYRIWFERLKPEFVKLQTVLASGPA